jgi:hypothetical protein
MDVALLWYTLQFITTKEIGVLQRRLQRGMSRLLQACQASPQHGPVVDHPGLPA